VSPNSTDTLNEVYIFDEAYAKLLSLRNQVLPNNDIFFDNFLSAPQERHSQMCCSGFTSHIIAFS
jgi:hypothetical protein